MKVTKFVHSCLLIEGQLESGEKRTILIDPGKFSWDSRVVKFKKLPKIDRILITHEHADHFHLPFIKALKDHSPDSKIVTNESIVKLLAEEGITSQAVSTSCSKRFDTDHEPLGKFTPPQNTGFHILEKLTHPGDSHHFSETKEILALPVSAPWGSIIAGLELATKLKPKTVIPIHDWHWSDPGREWSYGFAKKYLADTGVEFMDIKSGQPIEV